MPLVSILAFQRVLATTISSPELLSKTPVSSISPQIQAIASMETSHLHELTALMFTIKDLKTLGLGFNSFDALVICTWKKASPLVWSEIEAWCSCVLLNSRISLVDTFLECLCTNLPPVLFLK
jgi:hypothetical protein